MTPEEKWDFLVKLDEELLKGGVILSEWSTFLVRDADTAFASGASLAAILTAVAAIESHLRYEYSGARQRLVDLIDSAPIEEDLRTDLHRVRRYRNKWVHVADPDDDEALLACPERYERELEDMARLAVRSLRRVLYTEQCI